IRRIRLDNFMCHNKLTVDFHKYINIINGQNGTGKSAVLTALTIALGCRPKLTGRCDALKDLVGPYADRSIVEVVIVQCRDDPYRGSNSRENWDFGKEVIIERVIQKTGASAFKIMTEDRTVVSTKKEDLMKILQHLNYQIENPVHVLSQKDAKTLLQSATKTSFYDFFFK
ncbi:Smc6/Rad18 DNA repair protein, partial [Guillardia theta CCMP2712]